MSTITWGMLQKSLVDNETIEQAIVRLVTEHNNDETAHLGVGQSLQSHKASEVIDHLAKSILAEKLHTSAEVFECVVAPVGGDYTSIQDAIDSGKKRIFVKAGTYIIDSPITIRGSNYLIQGENKWDTVIRLADGVNDSVIKIDGSEDPPISDITIRNFWINGNKTEQTSGHGIYIICAYTVKIEDCCVTSCKESGIYLVDSSKCSIIFNYITFCNINGIYLAMDESDCLYNSIFNNTIASNFSNQIYIQSGNFNNILSNYIQGFSTTGNNGLKLGSHHSIVVANQIITHAVDGIVIDGNNNVVYGNKCWNCKRYGIYVSSKASDNMVRLNYLLGNSSGGMYDGGTNTRKAASTTNDNIIS